METTTKWVLDPTHSELGFKVRHMMITNVKGAFKNFSIDVEGEDIAKSKFHATIQTGSINTNNEQRDEHLRSGDFFDAENFKTLAFSSTSSKPKGKDEFELIGNLTIKGITKEVRLNVEFGGISKDPWGNEKAGFSFEGKINRKDWDLNWNTALETGGVMVGEEVKINGETQFVKQS